MFKLILSFKVGLYFLSLTLSLILNRFTRKVSFIWFIVHQILDFILVLNLSIR